ncbi:MAG TPA: polysaccharide deacetylase family protein [Thalassobaculum sp.]
MFDVTLTFDNGPEPEVTPAVLDVLARKEVAATFFVLGHKLADPERRALAERAAAEGHWIGNHTYTHDTPLGRLPGDDVPEREIGRTQALIGSLGHPDRLFRPFGDGGIIAPHLLSPAALRFLVDGGFTCVLWNVIPRDWEATETWPEQAMELMRPLPWSLVVVHDLPTGAMRHLGRFIDLVRAAGGRFRQDFPPDCVPLRRGRPTLPMSPYVAAGEPVTAGDGPAGR